MPIDVPSEPKIYTTTYANFKGVDYTNDASNVFKRRSPSGKNMLPDLDGRPYKRTGWAIKYPFSGFLELAESSKETVTPKKIDYFALGGKDYMIVFNDAGLFLYDGEMSIIDTFYVVSNGEEIPYSFPPSAVISGVTTAIQPDAGRSFFFEGNGTAGYYIFCGLQLFRLDANKKLYKVAPHIPRVLINCSPGTGAGTNDESINILTSERTVEYFADGTAAYRLPTEAETSSVVVKVINTNTGEWETKTPNTDYTVATSSHVTTVTFLSGHIPQAPTGTGDGNVRITYKSITEFTPAIAQNETYVDVSVIRTSIKVAYTDKVGPGEEYIYNNFDIAPINLYMANGGTYQGDAKVSIFYNDQWHDETFRQFNISQNAYASGLTVSLKYDQTYWNKGYGRGTQHYVPPHYHWNTESEQTYTGQYYEAPQVGETCTYTSVTGAGEFSFTVNSSRTEHLRFEECVGVYTASLKITFSELCLESLASSAFSSCGKSIVFGSGLYNQVFCGASTAQNFNTRVWYSAAAKPEYFPDTNYIEVGATDTPVAGFVNCDNYLGIVKRTNNMSTSIYLAYATSFDSMTTYAIKESVTGIGAVSNGAFNVLNGEPLFLSENGVMGIEIGEPYRLRNRSYYLNKKLCADQLRSSAVSFVHDNMYYLCTGDSCYVLDGSQKSSWENEKTNLQYECYCLDNIPAQCFAKYGGRLWFQDFFGNLCSFKPTSDKYAYCDDYAISPTRLTTDTVTESQTDPNCVTILLSDITEDDEEATPAPGDTVSQAIEADNTKWYTISEVDEDEGVCTAYKGVAISAAWSTIADDDGMVHFFKNLRKKGNVVSLLPQNTESNVTVYAKADEKPPVKVIETTKKDFVLPYDVIVKKKLKKYKRLQFILENRLYNSAFGVDQIIKSYTVGNYSKNRG